MISRLLKKSIPKDSFFKNVSVLVGGTAGAQIIGILSAPILTRLYEPDDFGLLAVFVSLIALFTVLSSLRYELAIPLPKSEQDAANLTVLGLCIVALTSVVVFALTGIFGQTIVTIMDVKKLGEYLWILPLSVFFIGSYQVLSYWCIRQRKFGLIAKTKTRQSVVTAIIQLAGAQFGQVYLIAGQVIGQSFGSFALIKNAFKYVEFRNVKISELRRLAIRYKQFPLFSTPSGFLNAAGNQLPTLILAALFDVTAAGLFMLANKILMLPISMIGSSISNVFLSEAPKAQRENRLGGLVQRLFLKLVDISLVPSIILLLLGPRIFEFIFGNEWKEAGVLASWMSIWLFFVFISSPLNNIFVVLEMQKKSLIFNGILLSARVSAIILGSLTEDLVLTIAIYSVTSAICWLYFSIWVLNVSGSKAHSLINPICNKVIFAIICCLPLIFTIVFDREIYIWAVGLPATLFILSYHYYMLMKNHR